jgi:hypothetical protein
MAEPYKFVCSGEKRGNVSCYGCHNRAPKNVARDVEAFLVRPCVAGTPGSRHEPRLFASNLSSASAIDEELPGRRVRVSGLGTSHRRHLLSLIRATLAVRGP